MRDFYIKFPIGRFNNKINLAKLWGLEKVDIRTTWNNEALDFTPWLAKKENILILSNEIGIEIDLDSIRPEEAVRDLL